MPHTGLFILLFLVIHLLNFTFSGAEPGEELLSQVVKTFHTPRFLVLYPVLIVLLGIHISHGFQSAFQTLGVENSGYSKVIRAVGIAVSILFTLGFALIPVLVYLFYNARGR